MKGEIISLTSIRGIAAIAVVIYHFIIPFNREVACISCHLEFLDKSYLSVDLFFILSGFILSYIYLNTKGDNKGIEPHFLYNFYVARVARIYPLHLFSLLFFASWILFMTYTHADYSTLERNNAETFFYNLFLIHSWGVWDDVSWNYPSWSISAELFAYIVFPFVCLYLSKDIRFALVCFALSVLMIFINYSSAFEHPMLSDIGNGNAIFRCISEFMFGALGYRIFYEAKLSFRTSLLNVAQVTLLLVLALSVSLDLNDFIPIILFLPLIFSISTDRGVLSKVLALKPLYFLGTISYSIYLTHAAIFMVYRDIRTNYLGYNGSLGLATESLLLVFMILVTVLISSFTYTGVELKSRNVLKSLLLKKA